jgi:hypothetical protein
VRSEEFDLAGGAGGDEDPLVVAVGIGGEDEEAGAPRGEPLSIADLGFTVLEADLDASPEAGPLDVVLYSGRPSKVFTKKIAFRSATRIW